jgi:uncharacterized protein YneF (UPF0154 family)
MKKTIFILIAIALLCCAGYFYFSGISWKSFWALILANGFGVSLFAMLLTSLGRNMADTAIKNVYKRVNDARKF